MNHSRPIFLKLAFAASMLLWASIAVTPATAGEVQFNFTGVVNDVNVNLFSPAPNPPNPFGFNTGQTMSGFFKFESTTADTLPVNTNFGQYDGAITALSVTLTGPPLLPSYTATLGGGANVIRVQDGVANDQYQVDAPVTGGDIKGLSVTQFNIDLTDITAGVFAMTRYRRLHRVSSPFRRMYGASHLITAIE